MRKRREVFFILYILLAVFIATLIFSSHFQTFWLVRQTIYKKILGSIRYTPHHYERRFQIKRPSLVYISDVHHSFSTVLLFLFFSLFFLFTFQKIFDYCSLLEKCCCCPKLKNCYSIRRIFCLFDEQGSLSGQQEDKTMFGSSEIGPSYPFYHPSNV